MNGNFVPAESPQERRADRVTWREPQHTSAAVRENNMGGIGAGMIVAAFCVLILPAWYFWPLPAWAWATLFVVATSLAVGGAINLVRFGLDEWRGVRWVNAARRTMLEQEREIARWQSAHATERHRVAELERDNAALKRMLEAKHPNLRYADPIDSTATWVEGPDNPQPVREGERRDPQVMTAIRILVERAQAPRPDVSRSTCVPAFMARSHYDEAMRILSIVGVAHKEGGVHNAPWTIDRVADVKTTVAQAERYVSPALG